MNAFTSAIPCRISCNDSVRHGSGSCADDGHAECIAQRLGQANQQRERQIHDVEPLFARQPPQHLADFLVLMSVRAFEHRDRHLTEAGGVHLDLALGRHPQRGI